MGRLLEGVRVLDLTRMLTGDYASMLLADMGAEVIKIEAPRGGDPLRSMPPHFIEGESAYFLSINRNKRSVTLDLRKERGREIFYELVKRSDVVFDNFRPGVLERLGADYETLKKYRQDIICCSISSYGHTGPYKDYPGFDLVIQALSGMMSYTGEPRRVPVRMGAPMGDLAGSMFAVFAICAALIRRERTGEGGAFDISLLDSLISMHTYVAEYYWLGKQLPELVGSGHMSVVPYRAYRTKDGFLVIAVFVEKFWQKLCDAIGMPELGVDERYDASAKRLKRREEVDRILEERLLLKTTDEWMERLNKAGVPAAPVLRLDEVFEHPQVLERRMVVEVEHPKVGRFKMLGNPVKEKGDDKERLEPPPLLGEHTEEVLKVILNFSDEQVESLREEGVI